MWLYLVHYYTVCSRIRYIDFSQEFLRILFSSLGLKKKQKHQILCQPLLYYIQRNASNATRQQIQINMWLYIILQSHKVLTSLKNFLTNIILFFGTEKEVENINNMLLLYYIQRNASNNATRQQIQINMWLYIHYILYVVA